MSKLLLPRRQFWTSHDEGTGAWHGRIHLGPVELGFHLYRHSYVRGDRRFVVQPWVIFDTKPKT